MDATTAWKQRDLNKHKVPDLRGMAKSPFLKHKSQGPWNKGTLQSGTFKNWGPCVTVIGDLTFGDLACGDLMSQGPCVTGDLLCGDLAFGRKRLGTLHSGTLCPFTPPIIMQAKCIANEKMKKLHTARQVNGCDVSSFAEQELPVPHTI